MNLADISRRVQFLADHPAKRGFNLLASHRLVERLIDEGLVTSIGNCRRRRSVAFKVSRQSVGAGRAEHTGILVWL